MQSAASLVLFSYANLRETYIYAELPLPKDAILYVYFLLCVMRRVRTFIWSRNITKLLLKNLTSFRLQIVNIEDCNS